MQSATLMLLVTKVLGMSTVLMITVGRRTFSDQLQPLTDQLCACADKMSGKRVADGSVEGVPATKAAKKSLSIYTVQKWIAENEKEAGNSNMASVRVARPQ